MCRVKPPGLLRFVKIMAGTSSWIGIGRQVLDQYLQAEGGGGGGDAGQMGVDVFINGFEDEFPGDADDPIAVKFTNSTSHQPRKFWDGE